MNVIARYIVAFCFVLSSDLVREPRVVRAEDIIASRLVSRICSDEGTWLWCTTLHPSQCEEFAQALVGPCMERVQTIDHPDAHTEPFLRSQLAQCVEAALRARYAAVRKKVSECSQLPIKLR